MRKVIPEDELKKNVAFLKSNELQYNRFLADFENQIENITPTMPQAGYEIYQIESKTWITIPSMRGGTFPL